MPATLTDPGVMVMFDLFAAETPEAKAEAKLKARLAREAEFRARFQKGVWVAPWDCGDGTKKGTEKPGWTCPDCGTVEVNEYVLGINHGYQSYHPGENFGGWCARMRAHRARVAIENEQARARRAAEKETVNA